jgi:hypothetical protein
MMQAILLTIHVAYEWYYIFQKYMEQAALLEDLLPDIPLYKVTEGNEPSFFTKFFAWDSAKAAVS